MRQSFLLHRSLAGNHSGNFAIGIIFLVIAIPSQIIPLLNLGALAFAYFQFIPDFVISLLFAAISLALFKSMLSTLAQWERKYLEQERHEKALE